MFEKMDEIKKAKAQTANGSRMIFYAYQDILVSAESLVGALDQLKSVGADDKPQPKLGLRNCYPTGYRDPGIPF